MIKEMGGLFFRKHNGKGSSDRGRKDGKRAGRFWKKRKDTADHEDDGMQSGALPWYEDDDSETGFTDDEDERTGFSSDYGDDDNETGFFGEDARTGFLSRYDEDGDEETGFAGEDARIGFQSRYDEDGDEETGFFGEDARMGFQSRYDEDGDEETGFFGENAHMGSLSREEEDDNEETGFADDDARTGFSDREEKASDYVYSNRLGSMPGMNGNEEEEETGLRQEAHYLLKPSEKRWMPLVVRTMTGENIFVSETPFYIGRSQYRVHFRVNNPQISNMHAVITRKNDTYYIKDTGSLNGTYINGERLDIDDSRALYNGMVFELAGETFTVIFRKVEV